MIEQTVPTGLNMDTNTGPLFSSAQPLKLKDIPVTAPDCEFTSVIENIIQLHTQRSNLKLKPFKKLDH